jgi:hypothetical protein
MADFSTWLETNKGLWTRVYDEVIAPDFEKEWKKSRCLSVSTRHWLLTVSRD